MFDLDRWAAEQTIQRKFIWVSEDYIDATQFPHIGGNNIPDGFRPETDAEIRERIKHGQT